MLTPTEALQIIQEWIRPLGVETVPLTQALNRVAAHGVLAPFQFPPFDNSAMDGFALWASDTRQAQSDLPVCLPILSSVAAGDTPLTGGVSGGAARIMTGAPLPAHADAVLKLEEALVEHGQIGVRRPVAPGENVRFAGEDIQAGETLIQTGDILTPSRLGLLAAMGMSGIAVFRQPRIAILTTGNELVEPGESLGQGQIYNSNQYALWATILAAGAQPVILGTARDEAQATDQLLEAALDYDGVVTSGGVSKGDHDWVGRRLAHLGTVHFTQVAQKPGKPMTFATVRNKPVFGLPGNPAATLVAAEVYVRPALRKMLGHPHPERRRLQATLDEPLSAACDRTLFLRGWVERDDHGGLRARLAGGQGSGILKSLAVANSLLVMPAHTGPLKAGDQVEVLIWNELDP